MTHRPRRDLYQDITDRILDQLERGTVPWRNPIKRGGGEGWPKNLESGKRYRGVNVFLLAMRAWEQGYGSDYWLTFRQAKAHQGQVRKGEKSSLVVFWKQVQKRDEATKEEVTIPFLRHYHVFNVEQCAGIRAPDAAEGGGGADAAPFEPLARAEQIVAGYRDGPQIEHSGSRAYYRPRTDEVILPVPEKFDSRETYYGTLYHELSHSTGIRRRLHRGLEETLAPFGSADYGKEELVAEMSAAFLCAASGISPPTIEQSAAYIDNWRRTIQGDKRLVVTAAGAAQRSADWILGDRFGNSDSVSETTVPASDIEPEPKPEPSTVADRAPERELF